MSSNKRLGGFAFCLLFLPFSACSSRTEQRQLPSAITCPASLVVKASAVPVLGWHSEAAEASHSFERISIYNGQANAKEFELAPDGQRSSGNHFTQTWNLKGYRTMNIFLRCRYRDTPVALYVDVPQQLDTCTFRFTRGNQGSIQKPSMECR